MMVELCEQMLDVSVSNRVIKFLFVLEDNVLILICGCAPQSGMSFEEDERFDDELIMSGMCMMWMV